MNIKQCPNCHLAMTALVEQGIEIDHCPDCGGVWLDEGELEAITNGGAFTPHPDAEAAPFSLRCPVCDSEDFGMRKIAEGISPQCRDCGGLFLANETIQAANPPKERPAPFDLHDAAHRANKAGWLFVLVLRLIGGR